VKVKGTYIPDVKFRVVSNKREAVTLSCLAKQLKVTVNICKRPSRISTRAQSIIAPVS